MGRRRMDGNDSLQKNNSIQNSEGNEEFRYPANKPNKTTINNTKEPSVAHKNTLKEEILQEITENFMEKIPNMLNKNVQDSLKKF
jgi:DNA polymerase/3'-5' exonuclease PolX